MISERILTFHDDAFSREKHSTDQQAQPFGMAEHATMLRLASLIYIARSAYVPRKK